MFLNCAWQCLYGGRVNRKRSISSSSQRISLEVNSDKPDQRLAQVPPFGQLRMSLSQKQKCRKKSEDLEQTYDKVGEQVGISMPYRVVGEYRRVQRRRVCKKTAQDGAAEVSNAYL